MVDFQKERERGKFPHSVTRNKLFLENICVSQEIGEKGFGEE